ncbi:MAG: tetratricopeptide repeat protein [Candidatus Vecturithrix sp.]|nr:tetratricopeptide repeat protein [Candidatus Vecturithrix sp.]
MKRSLLFMLGLCVLGCCLISCGKMAQETTLMHGRKLEEQGDYIGAFDYYQQIKNHDFRQTCTSNLRYLYGDILDALLIQKNTPDAQNTHYVLGKAYYEKASSLPQGIEITPNMDFDSQTYFSKQREHFQNQAMKALTTATSINADDRDALLLQAALYEEGDAPEQAIPIYQRLLALQPESPKVSAHLGQLLYREGQIVEGLELAEQAVQYAPDNAEAHSILAGLYAEEGQEIPAIQHFQHAICADPHEHETYYRLSQIFLYNGNLIDAERVLRLGYINNPDALSLGLFYAALSSLLDGKAEDEAKAIIQQMEGKAVPDQTGRIQIADESPKLQIRYLHLRMKLIQRQRPYWLPCSDEEENPYFDAQLQMAEQQITALEQLLTEAKSEP